MTTTFADGHFVIDNVAKIKQNKKQFAKRESELDLELDIQETEYLNESHCYSSEFVNLPKYNEGELLGNPSIDACIVEILESFEITENNLSYYGHDVMSRALMAAAWKISKSEKTGFSPFYMKAAQFADKDGERIEINKKRYEDWQPYGKEDDISVVVSSVYKGDIVESGGKVIEKWNQGDYTFDMRTDAVAFMTNKLTERKPWN